MAYQNPLYAGASEHIRLILSTNMCLHTFIFYRTVRNTVDVIIDELFQQIVSWPENTHELSQQFYAQGGFPSVCGCVDGTMIKIDAPTSFE